MIGEEVSEQLDYEPGRFLRRRIVIASYAMPLIIPSNRGPIGDAYEDQVRSYFLFLRQHKQFSGSAMSIGKAALRLFFGGHLGHADWKVFSELVIRRTAPLPLVLSREEVHRTLGCLREERFRVCPRLISRRLQRQS